jgi:flagellar biosynthetic protein FliQ
MTPETVVQLMREALILTFWLAAPLLAVGFIVGVAISLLQIATSIQDNAVSSIPRLTAFMLSLLIFLPWMLQKSIAYTTALLGDLGRYAR